MSTEIVKIDPKEFGVEDSKAADIAAQFKPMLDKMVELESEYNKVLSLPIELSSTAKAAKELRLKYVKVRTGTKDIHKAQKEFYLAGGRFVDGWKNAQQFASIGKEDELERIEKYAETLEKNRTDSLHATRLLLLPEGSALGQHLGLMSDEVWDIFLQGAIANDKLKKEQEELARLADEEARQRREIEENRIRLENEALKAELDRQKSIAEEEQRKINAELFKKRVELEAIEAAQKKAIAEAEALREAELSKGDSEKIESLILDLKALSKKYSFKSKKHKAIYASVGELIEKVVVYIDQKSNS